MRFGFDTRHLHGKGEGGIYPPGALRRFLPVEVDCSGPGGEIPFVLPCQCKAVKLPCPCRTVHASLKSGSEMLLPTAFPPSSQIITSPLPLVSSPPSVSKAKESSDSENLEVRQRLLLLLLLKIFNSINQWLPKLGVGTPKEVMS